jgi:GATA-binding protein
VGSGRGSGSGSGASGSGSSGNVPIRQAGQRSETSTPDLGSTSAASGTAGSTSGEDADQVPTVCTNCQTTNTPLWRRDPEGQPLCAFHFHSFLLSGDYMVF